MDALSLRPCHLRRFGRIAAIRTATRAALEQHLPAVTALATVAELCAQLAAEALPRPARLPLAALQAVCSVPPHQADAAVGAALVHVDRLGRATLPSRRLLHAAA